MHRRMFLFAVLLSSWLGFASAVPVRAQASLVNMVPPTRSGETNQDSEPTIAINPSNKLQLVGTAFTWDNLAGTPMVGTVAPVYVTTNGGQTWSLVFSVPSSAGALFPTGDITAHFSGTTVGTTNTLYTGILHAPEFSMRVYRAADYRVNTPMTLLDTRTNNVDQPHTEATLVGRDRLYVGFNNGFSGVAPKTATVDFSQNPDAATPTFNLNLLEVRSTGSGGQDGFAIMPAVHTDGTVYATFFGWRSGSTMDIVVMRDDNFGLGGTPFRALTDSGDAQAGQRIVTGVTIPTGSIGQERVGSSSLSIAVDPNNSSRVYVAWLDLAGSTPTLHVRRSIDRGQTWSASDMVTVSNALNPSLAINVDGKVGFLYQQLTGTSPSQKWETHFVRTTDLDATVWDSPGITFASTSASTPTATFSPYIGDYDRVIAMDRNFYGIFSASNFPDKANFLPGVSYQRFVNWSTHKLFADAAMTTEVAPSIDPFFFVVNEVAPPQIQVPANITFPLTCSGSATVTASICNTGQAPLIISSISSSNPQFSVAPPTSGFPVTIAGGACLPIEVTFSPTASGPQTGTITVTSNDPVKPSVTISVSGVAGKPTIATMVVDTGNFGRVCQGTSRDKVVTIANSGTCPLVITNIASSSAEFQVPQVLSYPLVIAPGTSMEVPIRLQPTSPGPKTTTLTISSNDPAAPTKNVTLTGDTPPAWICHPPTFASLGMSAGPTFGSTATGSYTFSGQGRAMVPFGPEHTFGVQAQGEFLGYDERYEGQMDIGLLNRWKWLQGGVFGSFKEAEVGSQNDTSALGQAGFTLDILLNTFRLNAFGSKGFHDDVPGMRVVDQFGGGGQVSLAPLLPKTYLEGNLVLLHPPAPLGNRPGAMIRVSHELFEHLELTAEVSVNETLLASTNDGRVVFGFTFGRWARPRDLSNHRTPLGTDVPRVRYVIFP
jgi:hypothetical protein